MPGEKRIGLLLVNIPSGVRVLRLQEEACRAFWKELGVSVHFLSATGCTAVLFLRRLDGLPMNGPQACRIAQ